MRSLAFLSVCAGVLLLSANLAAGAGRPLGGYVFEDEGNARSTSATSIPQRGREAAAASTSAMVGGSWTYTSTSVEQHMVGCRMMNVIKRTIQQWIYSGEQLIGYRSYETHDLDPTASSSASTTSSAAMGAPHHALGSVGAADDAVSSIAVATASSAASATSQSEASQPHLDLVLYEAQGGGVVGAIVVSGGSEQEAPRQEAQPEVLRLRRDKDAVAAGGDMAVDVQDTDSLLLEDEYDDDVYFAQLTSLEADQDEDEQVAALTYLLQEPLNVQHVALDQEDDDEDEEDSDEEDSDSDSDDEEDEDEDDEDEDEDSDDEDKDNEEEEGDDGAHTEAAGFEGRKWFGLW